MLFNLENTCMAYTNDLVRCTQGGTNMVQPESISKKDKKAYGGESHKVCGNHFKQTGTTGDPKNGWAAHPEIINNKEEKAMKTYEHTILVEWGTDFDTDDIRTQFNRELIRRNLPIMHVDFADGYIGLNGKELGEIAVPFTVYAERPLAVNEQFGPRFLEEGMELLNFKVKEADSNPKLMTDKKTNNKEKKMSKKDKALIEKADAHDTSGTLWEADPTNIKESKETTHAKTYQRKEVYTLKCEITFANLTDTSTKNRWVMKPVVKVIPRIKNTNRKHIKAAVFTSAERIPNSLFTHVLVKVGEIKLVLTIEGDVLVPHNPKKGVFLIK